MSWTYSGSPADSTLDRVRFLVGQTSTSDDVLLQDEEITWALSAASGVYNAAALCADSMQSRYALEADSMSVGQTQISFASRGGRYGQLAARLRQQAILAGVAPYAGGISVSDKDSQADDSDTVFPFATIADMDNPGSST